MRHAVTVNDGGKVLVELLRQVGKCLLPYPDPIRRRRLRRHAHALVSWTNWPGDTATPVEVAELAASAEQVPAAGGASVDDPGHLQPGEEAAARLGPGSRLRYVLGQRG